MKYLVLSYNDHDEIWIHHGVRDSYDEATALAANHHWPDNPYPLTFAPRTDFLAGVFSAWEGHDQYFIIPVVEHPDA